MRRECGEGLGRPNERVGRGAAGRGAAGAEVRGSRAEAVDTEPACAGCGSELLERLVAEEGRVRIRVRVRVRVRVRSRVRVF